MKKKTAISLILSLCMLAMPLSAMAGDSSDWMNYSPVVTPAGGTGTTTAPTTPAAQDKTQNTAGSSKDQNKNTAPAEAPAPADSTASVDPSAVKGSVKNADGSSTETDLAALAKGTGSAINSGLLKIQDASKLGDALNAFATDAPQKSELVDKLDTALAKGATARTLGTMKAAASGKDKDGNTIATPGEYKGSASEDALFILTSVNSDGTVERVLGELVPVTDKKKNTHNMLYGAFAGTPETILVTIVE